MHCYLCTNSRLPLDVEEACHALRHEFVEFGRDDAGGRYQMELALQRLKELDADAAILAECEHDTKTAVAVWFGDSEPDIIGLILLPKMTLFVGVDPTHPALVTAARVLRCRITDSPPD